MSQLALQLINDYKENPIKYNKRLDLGNCGLNKFNIPDELFKLKDLEELILSSRYYKNDKSKRSANNGQPNNFGDIPESIKELQNLKILIFNGEDNNYKLKNIESIQHLKKLEILDLFDNRIDNIEPLINLTQLKDLNLSHNYLKSIDILCKDETDKPKLIQLKKLNLGFNKIKDINSNLLLEQLTILAIHQNQIESIEGLKCCKKLEKLILSGNKIKDIVALKELFRLKYLNLDSNKIKDINVLKEFNQLEILALGANEIEDIQPISSLQNLEQLLIPENNIRNIEPLKNLRNLTWLHLFQNPIKIKEINTRDIKNVAINVKEYFEYFDRQADQNKVKVQLPVKVVLLGNHASGKSTFTNFFINNELRSEDSTHILRIENYPSNRVNNELPEAVLFDFGGQDYYHGLYRIYLSNQSINLIFWREKHNLNTIVAQDSNGLSIYNFNLNYWLAQKAYFERHSQMSDPSFLIKTHTDESHKEMVPQTSYTYEKHFDCCLAKENEDHINRDFLKTTLKKEIETLRQKNSSEEPQWYINFLTYLYNDKPDNPFEPLTFEYILDNHYERTTETIKDKTDFLKVNLLQLHNSGIILFYDKTQLHLTETSIPKTDYGLIWTNPSALAKKLHQEVFNRDKLLKGESPGITTLESLSLNSKSNTAILELLKIQKVIFYHTKENKYIIPNFLKLSSQFDGHYHILKRQCQHSFALQFKHFVPFGIINELMCFLGEDANAFCRNGIIFELENNVISIELEMDKLQIVVSYILKDKAEKPDLDFYIFLVVMAFYNQNRSISYKEFQGFKNPDFRKRTNINASVFSNFQVIHASKEEVEDINYFTALYDRLDVFFGFVNKPDYLPVDLFITMDQKNFVKFQDINIEGNEILAFDEYGNSLNKHISKTAFNSFMENPVAAPKKVFISYSHKDIAFRERLQLQLKQLVRQKRIAEVWSDHKIKAGDNWNTEIENKLKEAEIVFLLISDLFFASDFIDEKELPIVKERYEKKECIVIPILVKPSSNWKDSGWSFLQAIPSNAKDGLLAISKWTDEDDAWSIVTDEIKRVLQ